MELCIASKNRLAGLNQLNELEYAILSIESER